MRNGVEGDGKVGWWERGKMVEGIWVGGKCGNRWRESGKWVGVKGGKEERWLRESGLEGNVIRSKGKGGRLGGGKVGKGSRENGKWVGGKGGTR